jgi:hypothetical protein
VIFELGLIRAIFCLGLALGLKNSVLVVMLRMFLFFFPLFVGCS